MFHQIAKTAKHCIALPSNVLRDTSGLTAHLVRPEQVREVDCHTGGTHVFALLVAQGSAANLKDVLSRLHRLPDSLTG
jgi:mannose/cellobiose epimerase-like protein (N-acyl-D-glucosamine 2-epimerase family)